MLNPGPIAKTARVLAMLQRVRNRVYTPSRSRPRRDSSIHRSNLGAIFGRWSRRLRVGGIEKERRPTGARADLEERESGRRRIGMEKGRRGFEHDPRQVKCRPSSSSNGYAAHGHGVRDEAAHAACVAENVRGCQKYVKKLRMSVTHPSRKDIGTSFLHETNQNNI